MVTIAVDIMGSDAEPSVLLEGVAQALDEDTDLEVLVASPSELAADFCRQHPRARLLPASELITMNEHPATAVRQKKDASIVRAAAAVHSGEAQGLFSAGSTGAVLTAATFGIGRIKGIKRPALTLACPTVKGTPCVFLDVGANADVRPEAMVQFAQMGVAYARCAFGVEHPRVGLLCNGAEETKGSALALEYHAALTEAVGEFVGNAEGNDLLAGNFDVIVSDGFTGNVALKATEGTAKFVLARLKQAMASSFTAKLGLLFLKKQLKSMAAELSGDEYGGAVLLGLKGVVIKGHGATSSRAVAKGTLFAAELARSSLVERISEKVQ